MFATSSFRNFNSIKVQLKPAIYDDKNQLGLFQFHKGTIKAFTPLPVTAAKSYFNSIKVQLKREATLTSVLIR